MAKVGLVFGGRSVEHRVSVSSARTVRRGLLDAGHEVVPLGIASDGSWTASADGRMVLDGHFDDVQRGSFGFRMSLGLLLGQTRDLDVLFPVVHGTWGEDGSLQGLAEMFDLPYVGTDVAASAVAMDKLLAKQVLAASGVAVVDFETVERRQAETDPDAVLKRCARLGWPLFVKPAIGGSSVGVSKVSSEHCFRTAVEHGLRFADRLVVERAVVGRELECAVLGYRTLQASVIGEIVPGKEFYDYADKYLEDTARLIAPADLPEAVATALRETAIAAFTAIGGHGMARVDFLLEGDQPEGLFVNEINTLPGFTDISMYPRLWELSGVPLAKLVDRLVQIAIERHADRRQLDEGIKAWIAELAED